MELFTHAPLALAVSLAGAAAMLLWRSRETRMPVSTRSIVLPPLAMSTGFAMFVVPATHIPLAWGVAAFALGALVLFHPLARSSRLAWQGGAIVMQRSRAFLAILLCLVAVRLGLREYLGAVVTPAQTAALLFTLSFGMIVRWRASMLLEYRRLQRGTVR